MLVARVILLVLASYSAAGAVFATLFVLRGAERIDAAARGGPLGFRLLLWPGALALWPALLRKWMLASRTSDSGGPGGHSL